MTSTGRVARLTALALATGTLVAAGAGTAGAATTQKTDFTATGGGSVIRVTINLPAQLGAVLGAAGIPQSMTQDIVLTGGAVRTDDVQAIATSTLGSAVAGSELPVISSLLNKSVTATYGKNNDASFSLLPASVTDALGQLGIKVKALDLHSTVNNPTVDGAVSHSLSTVAELTVGDGTGALDGILQALQAQIQAILATALGTATASQVGSLGDAGTALGSVATTITGQLTPILDTLTSITGDSAVSDTVKNAANTLIAQLQALPTTLTNTLKASSADTSLLHVGLIESEQSVDRAAGVVTSTSSNKLVDVSALMGLVHVSGLSSNATAALGNGVSEATADKGQNAILEVGVKDLLTATLGSNLGVTLTNLPAPLNTLTPTINTALAQVTDLLNSVLGATLVQTKVGTLVEEPNHAASSVSAAQLTIKPSIPSLTGGAATPIFGDKPLLDISFVPATADVVKAQASVPPTITPAKATSQHQFARTGANFGLTAPIAVALMGLAVVARRRRLAHLGE